ncbi:MAG: hypothetical protein JWQ09_3737 [Segetibacter sp.]|nr:hypothetical protein [Segetibacter sp.]
MSELSDTIQETSAHASESRINAIVAICVAITATFMALCNVKDGNVVQAMSQAQAHSIDEWAYYQAKSTKEAILQNTVQLLKVQKGPGYEELIADDEKQIAHYEKEKAEIKKKAEGYNQEYEDINVFDDQFDMTDAMLSISVAMFGVTALTQRKWLLYFAASVSAIGIILGIAAFLKIPLHSDIISKILG